VVLIAASLHAHPGSGIVVDAKGQVYFVDGLRNRIMKIDAAGKLSVLVSGTMAGKLSNPHHLTLDAEGRLYSVGDQDGVVWRIADDGATTRVYPPSDWVGLTFVGSGGDPFTITATGGLFCINYRQFKHCQILKIEPDCRIWSLAGGEWGHADGKGAEARFSDLHGASFVLGSDGSLYLTDGGTSVRKVTTEGVVTTLAGGATEGFADGDRKAARFKQAAGLALDPSGTLYIADSGNGRIRKLSVDGKVSSLPGSFEQPTGVAVGPAGTLYVLEWAGESPRVKKIAADGVVTIVAEVKGS
jgi:sugar lactone lactonase YvrE